jgi:hypothetical protein
MLLVAAPLDGTVFIVRVRGCGGRCGDTRPLPFLSSFDLVTFPILIGMRTDESGIGTAAIETLSVTRERHREDPGGDL